MARSAAGSWVYRFATAEISACSRGLVFPASSRALDAAAKAGATASSCIGRLMLGPSTNASPQKHMAHVVRVELLRFSERALSLPVIEGIGQPTPLIEE